ncbi:MAG: ABC transporter permease [Erysipelotrichales bacterium]|nr:ABC transporter permease [Erysipelotrichales bacterium]
MNNLKQSFLDSLTMTKRCSLISLRNIDTVITSIVVPVLMMLLFVHVFGGAMSVGDYNFIDYIVPGIIIQCIGSSAAGTAISVNNDLRKGIFDRFRSMPISKSSVLTGHVLSAATRNILTTAIVILIAILLGFRPSAGIAGWLLVTVILVLYILAITWISVIFGLITNSPEAAASLTIVGMILPYISSGFVPTEIMSRGFRVFAQHQPMTPIINTIRALMMNVSPGKDLWIAIIWSVGLLAFAYLLAVKIYKNQAKK